MEPLEAAVTASCPLAFAGASGEIFVKAVTALVAAHCGIVDINPWPQNEAETIFSNPEVNLTFDFIVVGAGTAGSILSSRLSSHFPSLSVLLIEAGDDPGLDSEIPAFLFLNQNKGLDWQYKTLPDGKSCLGFNDNRCTWSKGRAMGGSSSINAMLYIRGHPKDYDEWSQNGIPGWSYKDLLPYFDTVENKLELQDYKHEENVWYDIINTAWKELGFNFNKDSIEAKIGTQITKLVTKDGKRLNTAKVYLANGNNLHVMKNTIVRKIIIDSKSKTASGVEIQYVNGKTITINANKEVILSAGSIGTPQILILSGIGPKKHLEDKNINSIVDLPVGKNLQDHILLPIFLKTKLHTTISPNHITMFVLQYMMNRTGPFSNIGITDFMGFIDTDSENYPNIQFHHTYFPQNDSFTLIPYLKGVGYKKKIIALIEEINKECDVLGIYPTLLHPASKGQILLANSDPRSKPLIKSNYFNAPKDLEHLLKGVKFIEKLTNTESFKALKLNIAKLNIPLCSNITVNSASYWECYIRHMATTIYHPVGTARMGAMKTGVVNEHLLVHGIRRLRIVDASIMPSLSSGNTMAPTMAIAEKAANIIISYYKNIKEEL